MKVVFKDFVFNGWHIDEYVCDLPQLHTIEDIPERKFWDHIYGELEDIIDFNESFEGEETQ